MNESVQEQVRGIAADILQVAPQELTPASDPNQIGTWDSVQHLNLILALEERFELQFEPEEIDQMKNVGAIVAIIEGKTSGTERQAA